MKKTLLTGLQKATLNHLEGFGRPIRVVDLGRGKARGTVNLQQLEGRGFIKTTIEITDKGRQALK